MSHITPEDAATVGQRFLDVIAEYTGGPPRGRGWTPDDDAAFWLEYRVKGASCVRGDTR